MLEDGKLFYNSTVEGLTALLKQEMQACREISAGED